MFGFTEEELKRYSRHILLPEIGGKGQKKIKAAKVLVIGTGGLGSPVAYYLAAAGVGTIGIIDDDVVDLSNLQRQILHSTPDLGRPKVISAKEKLEAINPEIKVIAYQQRLNASNVLEIIKEYDIVVDGTDNFSTRFVTNDACVLANKPFVHGGILQFFGQVMTIIPGEGPCFRCVFHEPPPEGSVPTCQEAGVVGALPGTIGTIQATEVIKYIIGAGKLLVGRMLMYEALDMTFREVKLLRNEECAICGKNPTIKNLVDYELPKCDI